MCSSDLVFDNIGKAGTDLAADAEAIGRLISLMLRVPSPFPPAERLALIVSELAGIGGSRQIGFGADRIRSIPDGIARALDSVLNAGRPNNGAVQPSLFAADDLEPAETGEEDRADHTDARIAISRVDRNGTMSEGLAEAPSLPGADYCPVCGHATFVHVEGCQKCYGCGHSEC